MKRPGYREAIRWIAENDDTTWIHDADPIPCVTVALVADLFGVEDKKVVSDIVRELNRSKNPS